MTKTSYGSVDDDVVADYVCPRCPADDLEPPKEWRNRSNWPHVDSPLQQTLFCCGCGGDVFRIVNLD
jgi:hypothetical protein